MAGRQTTKKGKAGKQAESTAAETGDAVSVVQLPADCRMAAQAALKAQLEQVLPRPDVVLDVSGLERVDTAALQLLVMFRRDLESQGGRLGWRGDNEVLNEAAGLLGLERLLTLPAATLA